MSARELDVLRLLGTDLDGPDIARTLAVSLNTMRTHTKNIYAKLGVASRRAAVRQAQELDLRRGSTTPVLWGSWLEAVTAAACLGTVVALYPVSRRVSPTAAIGFVTAPVA